MKLFKKYRITIVSLLILTAVSVIVGFAQTQIESRQSADDVQIDNKAKLLVVESITEVRRQGILLNSKDSQTPRKLEIKLRNDYKKPIVYYALLIKNASTKKEYAIIRGGLIDDWSLPTNQSDVNYFSAAPNEEIIVGVSAVLFDDGTGDGDSTQLDLLQSDKAGFKLGYERILPIIRKNLNQAEVSNVNARVEMLLREISSVNNENILINQMGGFLQVKDYVISEIKDLRENLNSDSELVYESKLNEQIAKIERTLAKL